MIGIGKKRAVRNRGPEAEAVLSWRVSHSFTISRAAEILGLNPRTVRRYEDDGNVPSVVLMAIEGYDRRPLFHHQV